MKILILLMLLVAGNLTTFAQSGKDQGKKDTTTPGEQKVQYSCPMHAEVSSNEPGKCPKCDMALTRSPKERMKMEVMKMYTCPMHSEVVSQHPGTCRKCNMKLVEKQPDAGSKKSKNRKS